MRHTLQLGVARAALFLILGFSPYTAHAGKDTPALKEGVYAVFDTAKGEITVELFYKKAPLTVTNFVGLADGTKEWTDPKTGKKIKKRFYDGLIFHRVIPSFMIQGGDPEGTGRGGPGYKFADEFDPTLTHDGPGVLSMANAGPHTNGSQFFITHAATPWLNNKHSVFGRVVSGQKVVDAIEKGDVMKTVRILRIGKEAQAFKADQAHFEKLEGAAQEAVEKKEREEAQKQSEIIKQKWPGAKKTPSGLMYEVKKEGSGQKPQKGQKVKAHYTGTLLSGEKFDSSRDRNRPFEFDVGMGRVIRGWDEAFMDMKKGERRILIIPPHLAYGDRGAPPRIPPKATLVFDVELIDFE